MNRLAIKIKEARVKAKMSEKDLAKACGQNINYILQIESGKKVINEQIAETILKILGEKIEVFQDQIEENRSAEPLKEKPKPAPIKSHEPAITPNEQWTDILAGVIKKFPVIDEVSSQPVDYKELSVLGKKIENINYEKVMFVKVSASELKALRILKGDVLTVQLTNEIQNHAVYYVEIGGKKSIRLIYKSSNNKLVLSKGEAIAEVEMELKEVKLIGKVIKVEFAI
ncbi:MAG TPA: XRE family transcriptional regulator [Clostridiales bacterium UBA8960]|nr:XRE family transcriptional regulator [Clostridiales bacterium UBA8960]